MYIGLDVAKGKSSVCVLNKNKKVTKQFDITHDKEGFKKLEKCLTKKSRIGMEYTGVYSKALYYYLKEKYDVFYVDSYRMHKLADLHSPTIKNDKVDAHMIAKYVSLNLKKIHNEDLSEMKILSKLYAKLVRQMAMYKIMFCAELEIVFPELEKHFSVIRVKALPHLLVKYPTPKLIAKASVEELHEELKKHVGYGPMRNINAAKKLRNLARKSIGVSDYPPEYFVNIAKLMLFYQDLIEDTVKKMEDRLKKTPYHALLDEYGYSTRSLAIIVGDVGDIRRFPSYKKFVKYCGLDVTEETSGKSIRKKAYITKKGSKLLRSTFYNMVMPHISAKTKEAEFFYRLKDESGKHAKKAMVAASRKIAIKTYHDMMRCHQN